MRSGHGSGASVVEAAGEPNPFPRGKGNLIVGSSLFPTRKGNQKKTSDLFGGDWRCLGDAWREFLQRLAAGLGDEPHHEDDAE